MQNIKRGEAIMVNMLLSKYMKLKKEHAPEILIKRKLTKEECAIVSAYRKISMEDKEKVIDFFKDIEKCGYHFPSV
jgi:predicted metal-binding transcription factor (methanogenesis marker protein 9)